MLKWFQNGSNKTRLIGGAELTDPPFTSPTLWRTCFAPNSLANLFLLISNTGYRYFRVALNGLLFVNEVLNFHDSTLCYHEPFHDDIKK